MAFAVLTSWICHLPISCCRQAPLWHSSGLALPDAEGEGSEGVRRDPSSRVGLLQVLIEDTDQLWHNHCLRDFKNEKPEEFESWREMYLRLHDAREQRLLMLARNIGSAHANKPKGKGGLKEQRGGWESCPGDVSVCGRSFGLTGVDLVQWRSCLALWSYVVPLLSGVADP